MNVHEIKDMLNCEVEPTNSNRYALAGYLEMPFFAHKEHCRHTVLKFIYGTPSVKKLDQWQIDALYAWLKPAKIEGVWVIDKQALHELLMIYRQCMIDAGQMELL